MSTRSEPYTGFPPRDWWTDWQISHQLHVAELEAIEDSGGYILGLNSRNQVLYSGVFIVEGPVFRIGYFPEQPAAANGFTAQLVHRIGPRREKSPISSNM